jgi:hypothetical protein
MCIFESLCVITYIVNKSQTRTDVTGWELNNNYKVISKFISLTTKQPRSFIFMIFSNPSLYRFSPKGELYIDNINAEINKPITSKEAFL